jgi:hypothetical protein
VLLAMGWRMMGKQNGVGETWDRNVAVIRSISGSWRQHSNPSLPTLVTWHAHSLTTKGSGMVGTALVMPLLTMSYRLWSESLPILASGPECLWLRAGSCLQALQAATCPV